MKSIHEETILCMPTMKQNSNDSYYNGKKSPSCTWGYYCVRPSTIKGANEKIEYYKKLEKNFIVEGKQLWFVTFLDAYGEVSLKNGFILTSSANESPSIEQIEELYQSFVDFNYLGNYVKNQISESESEFEKTYP